MGGAYLRRRSKAIHNIIIVVNVKIPQQLNKRIACQIHYVIVAKNRTIKIKR